ncbi:hypothetical protein RirG_027030 [Rhizophagus irregularis DAOM 197198w]|uniref:Uncharacterized protein n=1 Tax=Rhizophagus irregularis (strain DAOM 197198w) TaxID=1432141 RepID=A0A015K5P5_RHIIW|nr:hypothetical protein RirG_027030 [Rhizophagus irregularis DAOM 197198w]
MAADDRCRHPRNGSTAVARLCLCRCLGRADRGCIVGICELELIDARDAGTVGRALKFGAPLDEAGKLHSGGAQSYENGHHQREEHEHTAALVAT